MVFLIAIYYLFIFDFYLFIFFNLREKEHESGGEGRRKSDEGLDPGTPGS